MVVERKALDASTRRCLEQRRTMPETLLAFKAMTTARHISAKQQLTMFDQWHLRGQVIALENFHMITMITEADVIRPSISAGAKQPESVHGKPLEGNSLAIAITRCEPMLLSV